MERERDGVSRLGTLKERRVSTTDDIMTFCRTNDVRGIEKEACSIVADIDIMGYRRGWRVPRGGGREQNHSAEECERGENHDVS